MASLKCEPLHLPGQRCAPTQSAKSWGGYGNSLEERTLPIQRYAYTPLAPAGNEERRPAGMERDGDAGTQRG